MDEDLLQQLIALTPSLLESLALCAKHPCSLGDRFDADERILQRYDVYDLDRAGLVYVMSTKSGLAEARATDKGVRLLALGYGKGNAS